MSKKSKKVDLVMNKVQRLKGCGLLRELKI